MTPEAWDFAVTSCLRPATRNPGPTTTCRPEPCGVRKISHGRSTTQPTDATETASASPRWSSTDMLQA